MAVPTYLLEGGSDKVLCLTDEAEAAKYLAAIETSSAPSAYYGWMGVATHVEDDPVATPGGFTTSKAPLVLVAGDDGANVKPLQIGAGTEAAALRAVLASDYPAVVLLGTIDADTGAIKTAVELLDNAVDGNYLNVNANIAGADFVGGAGAVAAGVQRVTLASDDPAVAKLGTIDADTGAIKTAVEIIDNAIAGSEMQVDIVTVPAPLSTTGGGTEAAALRVTLANDSTGVVTVDDGGGALTIDGEIKDDGPSWTPVRKRLNTATSGDHEVWDPTAARIYITDILVSVSGTAVNILFGFGAVADPTDDPFWTFYGDVRGGATHHFRTPVKSANDNYNLCVNLSDDQQVDIMFVGYEKAT